MAKKHTKKALFASVMSLVLCFAMLVGTTFAWFTDEVESKENKIASGTLDIELYQLTANGWINISESDAALFDYEKWEPGYTQATVLKVKNAGTLALNWAASLTAITPETVTELADVIDVYVLEDVNTLPESFADIQGNYVRAGTLDKFLEGFAANTVGLLNAGEEATLGIALHMQEEANNDYQGKELGSAFDIRIFATQRSMEADTFGPEYDLNSTYPANYVVEKNDVPVNITVDENNAVTAASVMEDQIIDLGAQKNANVSKASVTIPAGAAINPENVVNGEATLNISIEEVSAAPEGIVITDKQDALPLEIKVGGLADGNDAIVTVYANIGAGRNDVKLYHGTVEMTTNAPANESFSYDKDTGDLYIYSKSFSPFTVVYEAVPVETVTLNQAELSIEMGNTANLAATVSPANASNKKVTWSSSNENVATVNENGVVTGVLPGTATITAKAGEINASCEVKVFKEYVMKLNRGHTQTSDINISTGRDFLPIAAVMPEIYGYSVYDGDTRIANSVCFRYSMVEKQDINENSYKVSFNLAIKDENGNDLKLKPSMPSTANGKEYLHMYVNLLELPEGYEVSDVKVNGVSFTLTNNDSGNPATGEYWIGFDGTGVYLQSKEAGLFEIIVAKAA